MSYEQIEQAWNAAFYAADDTDPTVRAGTAAVLESLVKDFTEQEIYLTLVNATDNFSYADRNKRLAIANILHVVAVRIERLAEEQTRLTI